MEDNKPHTVNDFKSDFTELVRGTDELHMHTIRDFTTMAKDFTKDPKQIKKYVKVAEQERQKRILKMGDEWTNLTDEKLNSKKKEALLTNTFRAVEKGLGDKAISYLGELEHRCCTKPFIRNRILSSLKELNFHTVARFDYYRYFEVILLQILHNIDDFTEYEKTVKMLINLPQSHKKHIKLKPKLERIAINFNQLKTNNFNINQNTFIYTDIINRWYFDDENFKILLRTMLRLSNKSLQSI